MNPGGKICGVCGEDCSGRPRIKDANGHYYCKGCYEQGIARKQAGGRSATPAPAPDEPVWDPFGAAAESAPVADAANFCPTCGKQVVVGAALCTSCGYNLATGQQLHSKTKRAQNIGKRRAIWPTVIGGVSLVFVALFCLDMYLTLSQPNQPGGSGYQTGRTIGTVIRGLITLWLAIGAVGLIQRQQSAAATLRKWAMVQVVIGVTCLGVPLLLAIGFIGSSGNAAMAGAAVVMLLVFLALALFWPIFLLVWFSRDFVKQEVGTWR